MKQNESINNILNDMRNFMLSRKNILTVDELEAYTGFSKSYIYKLTMDRMIPYYKREGGKILFFKRSEIDDWILSGPIITKDAYFNQASTIRNQKR